ncbi:MAG: toprim domain-containing protein [Rhizobiaceae bacterium]
MTPADYKRETEAIKTQLFMRMPDVAAKLLPRGKREGGLWVSRNPAGDDPKKKPALKVRIQGGDLGAWSDWRSGDKGDVFRLIEHCLKCDFNAARRWAMDYCGMRGMSREERARMDREAQTYTEREAKKAEKDLQWKLQQAVKLWNARADLTRSPWRDHALAYFAGRNCALDQVPNIARETFRYSRATEWWNGATWKHVDGRRIKTAPGPEFPAVHSALRNRLGIITCCHVTFLDPLKPKKASVEPPKLMFGVALGSVIEVSTGPEGKPFWLAQEAHPLIIAEGIETALSLAIAMPECRVWAGGSLAGVGAAPVDLDCISAIYFARDNNEGNPQAQQQFERANDQLAAHGKALTVMASIVGDDFNDLARGN